MDAASRKAEIVARMQAQRETWQAGREAAQAAHAADPTDPAETAETAPRAGTLATLMDNPLVRTVADHPLAAAGVVGVLLMLGPRRLLRLSGWVLPLFLRR